MPRKIRKSPPRPGPFAKRGGFRSERIPTIYVPNVKRRRRKPIEVQSIESIPAQYGPDSPEREMSYIRRRWLRWEERKAAQRARAQQQRAA
jgi:hypothetical protein